MASFKDPEVTREDVVGHTSAAPGATKAPDAYGVESSSDDSLDDNYEVYKATADVDFDESEAKRVLRKIDTRIVPVLFVTYFLQYLDKSESPSSPDPWLPSCPGAISVSHMPKKLLGFASWGGT